MCCVGDEFHWLGAIFFHAMIKFLTPYGSVCKLLVPCGCLILTCSFVYYLVIGHAGFFFFFVSTCNKLELILAFRQYFICDSFLFFVFPFP